MISNAEAYEVDQRHTFVRDWYTRRHSYLVTRCQCGLKDILRLDDKLKLWLCPCGFIQQEGYKPVWVEKYTSKLYRF